VAASVLDFPSRSRFRHQTKLIQRLDQQAEPLAVLAA
jgi:hypothetical protein